VVVTNRAVAGRTPAELGRLEIARGGLPEEARAAGEEMPIVPEMRIDRGDVVTLIGTKAESSAPPAISAIPTGPRILRT